MLGFSRFVVNVAVGVTCRASSFSIARVQTTRTFSMASNVTRFEKISKSDQDNREYRGLLLDNGLKILLVSDTTTDKSAAALSVQVGYLSDPDEIPGLAHFLEHMLFLGTEKYPSENEYAQFLSQHGGLSNAYTSADHTNYYFDVKPSDLPGALDRFAQFFLKPLFTPSATSRELNAVDSENAKNLNSDPWRLQQLEQATAKPGHPYTKFGTGNKETLECIPKEKGIDVRNELLKFHDKWYSSNIMSLAVLGKESLDELEEMVFPLFADVENKKVEAPAWLDHPYGPEQVGKRGLAIPIKDRRNLTISFPVPDMTHHYKAQPEHYLSHLLGHEGPGSLLSELKTRGWVNGLSAGQRSGARGFAFFNISVDLTEEGIKYVDDIVGQTFQYLKMLREMGPQQWVFEECRLLSAVQFRFKDKEKPMSYVSHLTTKLQDYPIEDVLSAGYFLTEFNPALIESVLEMLVPDNARIAVVAKQFESEATETEPWYGTRYRLEPIDSDTLNKWKNIGVSEVFHLPPKNEFIPENLDLVAREENVSESPVMIQNTQLGRVWFKQDQEFLLPKAVVKIEFFSPLAYMDPLHTNMASMLLNLVQDALNEYTYAATLAGLHYNFSLTKYGIQLNLHGYSDKLSVLLHDVMEKFTKLQVDPKRFEILKEVYIRALRNHKAEQPYQHSSYYTSLLMDERAWSKDELLLATDELTAAAVQDFASRVLSRLHLEFLIYGNLTQNQANAIADSVQQSLLNNWQTKPLFASQLIRDREYRLDQGCSYLYKAENSVHVSNCVSVYLQCGLEETRCNMLLELLAQLIHEPCFDTLRTREQLGYIVFSGTRRSCGVQGLRIISQSEKEADYVDSRIEAFLHSMMETLEAMPLEEFDRHKAALAARRLEKPKSMKARAVRFWSEITSGQYVFDRDDIEVACLKEIAREEILQFYQDYVVYNAPNRRKMAVHVVSSVASKEVCVPTPTSSPSEASINGLRAAPPCSMPTVVQEIASFKSSLALYPLVQPAVDVTPPSPMAKL